MNKQNAPNRMLSFIGKAGDFIKFMNEAEGIFCKCPTIPAIIIKYPNSSGDIKRQLFIKSAGLTK